MGSHSHRTPLSYPEYRKIFQQYIQYVDQPKFADIIIFAYVSDLIHNAEELSLLVEKYPHLHLVVVSEEPLWDTTNSGDFTKKENIYSSKRYRLKYYYLNHLTSSIYDFQYIPYFLTTSDDYYARYSMLFKRNSLFSIGQLKTIWRKAKTQAAFIAEKRTLVKKYNVKYPEYNIYGLSIYRTKLAEAYQKKGVLRIGKGWGTTVKRQQLPDWHLDKLATLDRDCYLVSALENTHQVNYISEKIFDAYAVLGIPIYWASENHQILKIINREAFINLFELEISEAVETLTRFKEENDFIDAYRETLIKLAELFSSPSKYVNERLKFAKKVVEELNQIAQTISLCNTGRQRRL